MVIIDRPKLWQHRQKQQQHGNNVDQKNGHNVGLSVGLNIYIHIQSESAKM